MKKNKFVCVRCFFKTSYRIVSDDFSGYEVQKWRWWFPFWVQEDKFCYTNTFKEIEDAKQWIEDGCPKGDSKKRTVFWEN